MRHAVTQAAELLAAARAPHDRVAAHARAGHLLVAAYAAGVPPHGRLARATVAARAVRRDLRPLVIGLLAPVRDTRASCLGPAIAKADVAALFAELAELAWLILERAPRLAALGVCALWLPQNALPLMEGGVVSDGGVVQRKAVPTKAAAAARASHVLALAVLLNRAAVLNGAAGIRAALDHAHDIMRLMVVGTSVLRLALLPAELGA